MGRWRWVGEDEDKGWVDEDEGWIGEVACMHDGGVVCRGVVLDITGNTLSLLGLGLARVMRGLLWVLSLSLWV